jgi:hypothetical protein
VYTRLHAEARNQPKKNPENPCETNVPGQCYTFRIQLSLDPAGKCWFLLPWAGCRSHKFHAPRSRLDNRLRVDTCTENEQVNAAIYARQGSTGVAAGIMNEQTGKTFSASQIRNNKNNTEIRTGHVPPPEPGDIPGVGSSAAQCIAFLEKEKEEGKKSYIALYHSVNDSTLLTIKKKRTPKASKPKKKPKKDKRRAGSHPENDDSPTELQPQAGDAQDHEESAHEQTSAAMVIDVESSDGNGIDTTTSVTLSPEEGILVENMLSPIYERLKVGQKILLAVIWVREDEKRLFELFPEVLMLDITFGTNCEGRPLAVSASFDAFLKTFTPIRAFLPSECQWVFLWIWKTAIPALLGHDNISRIQLVLTDGDTNIYNAFNTVQERLYGGAIHGLCSFHLVSKPLGGLAIREKADDAVKGMVKT